MNTDDLTQPVEDGLLSAPTLVEETAPPSHIVGIGASAGGLEALEQFFAKMPPHSGLAFVVVQHLSPDFKSLTDVLLGRRTSIPIFNVENGVEVQRDAIYLLPPRKEMILAHGKLFLTDKEPFHLMSMPIDHFFRSLAQDAGERAVGIILSGTGSDGSRGIRDIHEAGGLVLVQQPETAKFDGMPNSAEKTGVQDLLLSPEEMPQALLRHASHSSNTDDKPDSDGVRTTQENSKEAIFRLLREAYGIDFSHYRPATVVRRTERRLQLNGALTLDEYVQRLKADPEELNALYRDLLIGVTRFFRDREAFATLETVVLPQLLEQAKEKKEELRSWVAGCATGEEAYSIAILVQEYFERSGWEVPIKIFATDAHRASLELASVGVYQEASLTDMSPERLARHFTRKGDTYQISSELRKMVVFAEHNLIKDAPFTKLNLISCRNLLIYLEPLAQKKVLSMFHFGLKTGGFLFLGPSESPSEVGDEFDAVDSRWRIFRKRRDVRLPNSVRMVTPVPTLRHRPTGMNTPPVAGLVEKALLDGQVLGDYDVLLGRFMPPSFLVNEHRELLQSFGGANRYLKHRDGRFSADVLDMVDADLRMALTGALQRVLKEGKPVTYKGIRVAPPEGERIVNVTVEPIPNARAGVVHALISLQDVAPVPTASVGPQEVQLDEASREQMLSLESELRFTKENLQATIEELETSNEELQATNEELVASNEELQSTNEELHSVNEELYTVNGEYQKKIAELTELTTDVENLLTSTEVHTVFLDRNLQIRKFTPRIAETFNFLPQDIGRRIDSFTHTIDHPRLLEDLQGVLQTSIPVEKQVRDQRGSWFLLRILPYQVGLAVEGVVLTLIDIGLVKRLEAEAWRRDQQLAGILKNSPNPVSITDAAGRYVLTDDSFRQMVAGELLGKTPREIFPGRAGEDLLATAQRVSASKASVTTEVVLEQPDGTHTYLAILFPLEDERGQVTSVGNIMTDVTQLKQAESRALEAVTQRDRFLAMLSHELRNPLAAILNATSALRLTETQTQLDGELTRIIERRAQHMARLLDDLLDVARLTQNKIEIRKQLFNLAAASSEVLEEVRASFAERRIELLVNIADTALLVEGDPARLQQIQVNLLLNAARYSLPGGRVWYSVQREENQVVIRVRDTGVGIAHDMLERIFDLFVQGGNSPHQTASGIGVGLTMVRSIVELHAGRVKAYSAGPGQGSEFIVWLPLARETTVEPQTGETAEDGVQETPLRPPACRILIVEDDDDIRNTLQSILVHDGLQVRTAADGPAALALLRAALPDVALLDLGLPGMSGFELARTIRRQHGTNGLRLIALTGYGQTADRQATREAGFDAHLTKPLKPAELYRALCSLLSSRTE